MESNNSLSAELKKVTQELASHKIELYQTRSYLQCILQNATDLIFATDAEDAVVSFSKGGEKVLGYSWEEIMGRPVKDFAEDGASFGYLIATCQEEGSAVGLDVRFRHKDGKTVFCNISLLNLTNREGQRVGAVGICQDITEWKQFQEDLIRVDRLAEIGRIAAGVAHEINNPLAVINEVVKGNRVVVVDDSIVRGTTTRGKIRTIRQAGAKEIHMRVSCPPIRFPCFYGIDFPTKEELLANGRDLKQIAEFLEVDSVGYISLEGLLSCATLPADHYCTACWSGKYPIPVDTAVNKFTLEHYQMHMFDDWPQTDE